MTFTQHVEQCTAHRACTVIRCETDTDLRGPDGDTTHPAGTVVWHSHMHHDVHPEHRINRDHPAIDHRGRRPAPISYTEPCAACLPHFPAHA